VDQSEAPPPDPSDGARSRLDPLDCSARDSDAAHWLTADGEPPEHDSHSWHSGIPHPAHSSVALTGAMPTELGRFGRSRAGILLLIAVGGLGVAACSGSSAKVSSASNGSSAPSSSSSGALQAYRDCMSQHGVTLPARNRGQSAGSSSSDASGSDQGGPGGGGFGGQFSLPPGVDQATFDAAQQACASLRPTGGRGGAASAAYRSCLADHGVTVPSTSSGGPPPSIDRNDPNFAAASQACRALLPSRGSNGSSSSGSSDSASPASN
jgi:hypothetical protein